MTEPSSVQQIVPQEKNTEWYTTFNSRVNGELSLARRGYFTTHQWVITLTIGLITASLALGRAEPEYPTLFGLIAVLGITPLMVRFFVRSCLEYTFFMRWVTLRNALDAYFYAEANKTDAVNNVKAYLDECIALYYFDHYSPITIQTLVWHNLKLAYLWPMISLMALVIWGFINVPMTQLLTCISTGVAVFLFYEAIAFFVYKRFKYKNTDSKKPEWVD